MYIYSPTITQTFDNDFLRLEEVKHYLRIDHSEDDALLTSIIFSATEYAEKFLRTHILRKSLFVQITGYLSKEIIIPSSFITEITSFKYDYLKKSYELKEHEDFEFEYASSKILLQKLISSDKAHIEYMVGYDKNINPALKQGIMQHISHMYDGKSTHASLPSETIATYMMYRRHSL